VKLASSIYLAYCDSTSTEEIVERQKECRRLFTATLGWKWEGNGWRMDEASRTVPLVLPIWSRRIQDYHRRKSQERIVLQETIGGVLSH
jgi:hypothetical protein